MLLLIILLLSLLGESQSQSLEKIAEPYFRASEYQKMVLSPNGSYLAAETYYDAQEHIEVVDITNKKTYVIFNGGNGIKISITDINWVDEDTLIVQLDRMKSNSSVSIFKVIHLKFADKIEVNSSFQFEKTGYVVDNLIDLENKIYFAHLTRSTKTTSGIYKIDLSNQETVQRGMHYVNKIGSNISFPFYWLTDSGNRIKLILSSQKKRVYYWLKKGDKWKKIFDIDENSKHAVYPLAITPENNIVVIKRLDNKDKKGIYILDPTDMTVIKELFYSDEIDVSSVVFNKNTSSLIAIRYIRNGIVNDIIIDETLKKSQKLVKTNYSNFENFYLASNKNKNKSLFFIHNFQNEGIYVSVDLTAKKAKKIIQKSAWRNSLSKATLETLTYKTDDGFNIESYLSLPQDKKTKALLVMPHGGPIGARSYGYFDSDSHFLASFGIAVLKINYRGSSGFGNKFQEAGKKQWGNKIEKDINDVVSYVVNRFDISENNICAGGTSYGGYSSLMLHINYPERYKCIISMAGPTDLPLMFSSSDWNINKESIKNMIEIVGDPKHDIERLKSQSPVYNAKKIIAPVLLFHGTDDPRVNVEHSVRLEFILKKLNKPVTMKLFTGVKHGFTLLKHQILFTTDLLKFMNDSLNLSLNLPINMEET